MEKITHLDQLIGVVENYQRTKMQEEMILQKLKEKGCRITKQRRIVLNVILQEECTSCKEIYYKAKKTDDKIGVATVYRMINLLEEIGAISRKNMYKISFHMKHGREIVCIIELDDHTTCNLSVQNWYQVIIEGLKACGYIDQQNIVNIMLDSCLKAED